MRTQHTILKKYFGYDDFRTGQEEIVKAITTKQDVLAIMPTGAGKSLCYQIPALMLKGITLVISPLISLMKDQVNSLNQVGIPAAFLNSSLNNRQQAKVIENAQNNFYKLIYIAPEQLQSQRFIDFARGVNITLISIDEAHCVSQWGHDFRPSYLKIPEFIAMLKKRPTIGAFTATATSQVKEDIIQHLKLECPFSLTTGFNRENLYFAVKKPQDKFYEIQQYLKKQADKSGIIYCSTRKDVEDVCERLQRLGYSTTRYHAGLSSEERKQNQEDFVFDEKTIIVATNAFGMGIDKSNVAFVIHYNMPKNMESYYQEAGRAGRDGSPADCILLYSGKDYRTNQFFIDNTDENSDLKPDVLEAFKKIEYERLKQITFYCYTQDCLRQTILKYFGEVSANFCDNCSNCNTNFEKKDITIEAQKILSCVKRLDEKFGIVMVIDVLRGSKKKRLIELQLEALATYNLMNEYSDNQIRHMIQVLLAEEYLKMSTGEYPVLQLDSKARELLFNNQTLMMNLPKADEYVEKREKQLINAIKPALFSKLQALRAKLASEQKVPAYIIFSNASLNDMCEKMPKTITEMAQVSGVGRIKLEQYGEQFLTIIVDHEE